jgi:2-keto-4-pentenoate hydratase/2-oxohepta-3-ene-1,7-dioic acid hydratase in catechol pathway
VRPPDDYLDCEGELALVISKELTVRDGNTSNLIFTGAQIVAHASGVMTLKPGDLIEHRHTPRHWGHSDTADVLHPGDMVTVEIERMGCVANPVVQP